MKVLRHPIFKCSIELRIVSQTITRKASFNLSGGACQTVKYRNLLHVAFGVQLSYRRIAVGVSDLGEQDFLRVFVELHISGNLILPARLHTWRQMLKEMRESSLSASQMKGEKRSTGRPTNAERIDHHFVQIFDRDNATSHQGHAFPEYCALQSIRDEAGYFLPDFKRDLADRIVKIHSLRR